MIRRAPPLPLLTSSLMSSLTSSLMSLLTSLLRSSMTLSTRGALALAAVALLTGCPIEAEDLPGRPCLDSGDCGAFVCVRVDGRQDNVCVPRPPAEVEQGCDDVDDGDACGDGDACTVDDRCTAGVCQGDAKECDDGAACVAGVCEVAASCTEVAPRVGAENAAAPRIAYNAADDEVGVIFESPVLARTEVFFTRIGPDGAPRAAPVQLTDGTPATADDSPVSSSARDIAYAPEQQRYGVIVDRDEVIGGGISFTAVTADGIQVGGLRSMVTSLSAAFIRFPARLDWNGARFFAAVIEPGSEIDRVVFDSVDADGDGASIGNEVVASGFFGGVDVAASRRVGELGFAYTTAPSGAVGDVRFARANQNGDGLVERVLSTGRPAGTSAVIAINDVGYVVVWQESPAEGQSQLVGAALDDDGTVVVAARVLTDAVEQAQLPAIVGAGDGAVVVYFATVDGAFALRSRRLAGDLTAGSPQQLRAGLAGGFAPTLDGGGGAFAVSWGVTEAGAPQGDVETVRICVGP